MRFAHEIEYLIVSDEGVRVAEPFQGCYALLLVFNAAEYFKFKQRGQLPETRVCFISG